MQFKGYTLNAFQVRAAEAIAAGKNLILSAPTGAGKTLVAEYAIEVAVTGDRRAIYTSPVKALSNQKYRDFKADSVDVGLMTGDLTLGSNARVDQQPAAVRGLDPVNSLARPRGHPQ
jgi:superfamily II RNA helicase